MDDSILKNVLENYNTPAYIFDIKKLRDRVNNIRNSLPSRISLCYAIKANTFVVKEIEDIIDRFEVCSPGEYYICKDKEIEKSKIFISGVYKTPEVIKDMIENDEISLFSIESVDQFNLLKNICLNKKIKLLIRITSGNQFGINKEEAEEIIKNPLEYENLEFIGIQYFSGTQKKSIKNLSRELEYVQDIINTLKEKYDFETKELEFGPGFSVSYFKEDEYDEESFLKEFSNLINNLQFNGKIVLELGRALVANSGFYISKVVDKKTNKGQNYAILDGGINHLVYYGQFMAMKIPKCYIFPKRSGISENWNLCGSLCTINDILVKQFPTENLQIGDIFVFENTGAYCMTEGIALFLSRQLPSILKLHEDGKITVVRDNLETYKLNS